MARLVHEIIIELVHVHGLIIGKQSFTAPRFFQKPFQRAHRLPLSNATAMEAESALLWSRYICMCMYAQP